MTLLLLSFILANPYADPAIGQRLGIPPTAIQQLDPIRLDRRPIGWLVRYERDGQSYGTLLPLNGAQIPLGPVTRFDPRGVFDLHQHRGGLPMTRSRIGHLKSQGAQNPVLVFTVQHEHKTDQPRHPKGRRSRRATGIEHTETLHLITLNPLRRLLRLQTKRRAPDGFGGHRIGTLTLAQGPDGLQLTGSRQDALPARRARCMRPPPVPVRYLLTGEQFREVDHHPSQGCASRHPLKLPAPKPLP
jgi:hypothetical protein